MIIYDNFLEKDLHYKIWEYCNYISYEINAKDDYNLPPIGLSYNLKLNAPKLFEILKMNIEEKETQLKSHKCYNAVINCFLPKEIPYFHEDANIYGVTCLYYPNIKEIDKQQGGETQFLLDGEIKGILPIPNRLVIFDSTILHRATSFRDQYRFTVAFKYE